MTEEYCTLAGESISELTVERSRFIATAAHIESGDAARAVCGAARKRYPNATHHCYAYISDRAGNEMKFSDAGEPQGTAGMPILDVLLKRHIVQAVIVVTRYFGGVKLGAGGLVRAYTAAAAAALDSGGVVTVRLSEFFTAETDYQTYAKCGSAFRRLPAVVTGIEYGNGVRCGFVAAVADAGSVKQSLTEMTNGKIKIEFTKREYYPF